MRKTPSRSHRNHLPVPARVVHQPRKYVYKIVFIGTHTNSKTPSKTPNVTSDHDMLRFEDPIFDVKALLGRRLLDPNRYGTILDTSLRTTKRPRIHARGILILTNVTNH